MYFVDCKTIEELRAEFKVLCMKLHPDKVGGDSSLFVEMKNEYDNLLHLFSASEAGRANGLGQQARYTYESESELAKKIEELMNVVDITIEICGSWLWVGGNTYPVKDRIKAMGCKFSGTKKLWYWSSSIVEGKKRGIYTMDKIRNKFGSELLESTGKKQYQLA